jgi:CDP-diacylglycerol--serine O-phosphatidyltransferase
MTDFQSQSRFARRAERARKGILIIPTVFTVLNMLFGFAAVVAAIRGEFFRAGGMILLAVLFDGFDGRLARRFGSASDMGRELDSFADLVSFGVAPMVLAGRWLFGLESSDANRMGWLLCFVYLVCVAFRLARFNLDSDARKKFTGMPSPAAASILAVTIYMFPEPVAQPVWRVAFVATMLLLAFLMVSRIPFASLKDINPRHPRSHYYILPITLFIVLVASHPAWAFMAVSYGYLAGNLFHYFRTGRRASALEQGALKG